MKRFLLITFTLGAVALVVGALASLVPAAPPVREMAVVDIPDKTRLLKAELLGKYIFIHDDAKMSKGEPCFYVYQYSQDQSGKPEAKPENLVLSFHCLPVQRPKAVQVVLTYGVTAEGLFELREIQFADSVEGHRVP
jgi:hypothetical protein